MLIPARKSRWRERLYARYGRRLLRGSFARVWLGGAGFPGGDEPSIACLNHPAWWDPILAVFLSHDVLARDGYGIMDGAQLARFPFFRAVGCFGATTASLDDARAILAHSAALLAGGARRTLWVFPQGVLRPARAPLAFRSGVARLSRLVPQAPLVPIAVRYEQRAEQRPEIVVRVGAALHGAADEPTARLTRRLEDAVRAELARLDDDLARDALGDYRVVLAGRRSLSERWARARDARDDERRRE